MTNFCNIMNKFHLFIYYESKNTVVQIDHWIAVVGKMSLLFLSSATVDFGNFYSCVYAHLSLCVNSTSTVCLCIIFNLNVETNIFENLCR